jgi:hypothetical protein
MIKKFFNEVHIAPLAIFRLIFGAMMFAAVIRFIANGWVYTQYIQPTFFFPYYGFEWIKPLGSNSMYILFALMALSFFFVMLGLFYRISIITAFLSFTYVELIDKSNYLNHYYFISLVSFIMIFLPANRYFSLDVIRNPSIKISNVPNWTVSALKLQLAVVYIYAGIAKLNYDWLFRAMPLKIWLPAHSGLPIIGPLMDEVWVAYFFSWFGAVYDLCIVFFLLHSRTRLMAYLFVIVFHVMTRILFQIGMFPYIMIVSTLIFFSEDFHKGIIHKFKNIGLKIFSSFPIKPEKILTPGYINPIKRKVIIIGFALFFFLQILFPWRFLLYSGKLFWTEQGYRFSWRVMLMEKAGTAFFYVRDPETNKEAEVSNCDYLTINQEKMMATQPDMILQFAHLLKNEYEKMGINHPEVRVKSYVTLNGSGSRLFIDSLVDLTKEEDKFSEKKWILPFNEIYKP